MLRAVFELDRPVRPEFLDPIFPLTEGNPFFKVRWLTAVAGPSARPT